MLARLNHNNAQREGLFCIISIASLSSNSKWPSLGLHMFWICRGYTSAFIETRHVPPRIEGLRDAVQHALARNCTCVSGSYQELSVNLHSMPCITKGMCACMSQYAGMKT